MQQTAIEPHVKLLMMRNFKILFLILLMSISTLNITAKENSYDWDRLINAIMQVESKGNPKAYNPVGNCAGVLQITKTCVNEANNILKSKGIKKRFSLSDRWNIEKSKEIFNLIQEKYNPEKNVIKACRIWNEGPNYNKNIKTTSYVKKVLKEME